MSISEQDIRREERRWAKEKNLIKRKQKIDKEKKALKPKHFTTTKLIMFFLFLNCTLIELFTCWSTIQSLEIAKITMMSPDFTPLVTLIGTVVGEVVGFAIYAMKSMRENSAGGIIYDQAFRDSCDDDIDIQIYNTNMDSTDNSDAVG